MQKKKLKEKKKKLKKKKKKKKKKERENMHTDRCGNTCRQKCCAKGSRKETKIQKFMYIDMTNV